MTDAERHEIMAVDPETDLPEAEVAPETVRSGLDSDDTIVRMHAAKVAAVLGRADAERVAPLADDLADALDDERNVVSFQSAIALACIAEEDVDRLEPAVPELVAMLSDEFADVRELSARALATVVQDRSDLFVDHVDGLIAAAGQEPENVLDPEAEPEAELDPETVQSPTQTVNKEKHVQQMLARETAANVLAETATHDPAAAEPHVPDLVDLLSDPNIGVATAAADVLGTVAEENPAAVADAVDPLRDLLDEDDENLVAVAVRALGFADDPAAVPELRELAADEDRSEDLRDLAAETADYLADR